MSDRQFVATPTMSAFMCSDKFVRVIGGPIGSGKSVCSTHDLLRWSAEQKPNDENMRRSRFLITRNTLDQLKSTTMKTVFEWVPPGVWGEHKISDKTFYVRFKLTDGTIVTSEWMFMPLDTPDDIRKALSLELTGLWGNEARELHPEVVDGLISRVDRYPPEGATRPGAIFDTNMPDVDTWWHKKMESPPSNWGIFVQPSGIITLDEYLDKYKEDPDPDRVATASDDTVYVSNPEADNYAHLSPKYYPNNVPGKTQDFLDVYLRVKYGRSLNGLPVYDKTYRDDFHGATEPLTPLQSVTYPVMVGLDFGRTPAAVFGQMDHKGRVLVFSEVVGNNMGIEKFIQTLLRPHINAHYAGYPLIIAPDPAGWQKTQVGETSPVDILKREGFRVVDKFSLTNDPDARIRAVEHLLAKQIDGKAGFLINRERCPMVSQGFRYGYRWKLNKDGTMQDNSPVKNEWSHPHDALQYLALVVGNGGTGQVVRSERREVKPAPRRWSV